MKKIILLTVFFVLWFVMADAYWVAKDRGVSKCVLDKSTELVSRNLQTNYFNSFDTDLYTPFFRAKEMVRAECSYVEGRGNYWFEIAGMAYWEVIFTLPVRLKNIII